MDMAEDDDKVAKVRAINAGGTQNIADVCKKLNCKMTYVVCAGCSQGCKTDLRFAAGLHKERNAKGTGRRYGDEVSAEGTYSQG